jgi:hypothetical protein
MHDPKSYNQIYFEILDKFFAFFLNCIKIDQIKPN